MSWRDSITYKDEVTVADYEELHKLRQCPIDGCNKLKDNKDSDILRNHLCKDHFVTDLIEYIIDDVENGWMD